MGIMDHSLLLSLVSLALTRRSVWDVISARWYARWKTASRWSRLTLACLRRHGKNAERIALLGRVVDPAGTTAHWWLPLRADCKDRRATVSTKVLRLIRRHEDRS